MGKRRLTEILVLFLSVLIFSGFARAGEERDREVINRLIRLEEGNKALNKRIDDVNKRIDDVNKRIDDLSRSINKRIDDLRAELKGDIAELRDELRGDIDSLKGELKGDISDLRNLMYVIIGGIFALMAIVIWDRRTALSPVIRKTRELEEREEFTLRVIKEYARREPKLAEVLKSMGIW